mmetsp:Transcript_7587/g.22119  ORF Transcript_7587/g.22119 Transcript_7587/m.22119 type:complete len:236 (+) Transcript_7587:1522-2229(+)
MGQLLQNDGPRMMLRHDLELRKMSLAMLLNRKVDQLRNLLEKLAGQSRMFGTVELFLLQRLGGLDGEMDRIQVRDEEFARGNDRQQIHHQLEHSVEIPEFMLGNSFGFVVNVHRFLVVVVVIIIIIIVAGFVHDFDRRLDGRDDEEITLVALLQLSAKSRALLHFQLQPIAGHVMPKLDARNVRQHGISKHRIIAAQDRDDEVDDHLLQLDIVSIRLVEDAVQHLLAGFRVVHGR